MHYKDVFSGFSVNNLNEAKKFYQETLGLELVNDEMGLAFKLPSGGIVFIYSKDDHKPAEFTILNFEVDNIDQAVDDLVTKGISFERYENMSHADEKGIARGITAKMGPDIAWFKDPAGNILSVLQNS